MRSVTCAALGAVLLLAGACSSEPASDETVENCEFVAGAVCRDQDLKSVSFVAANLQGADFSGSDLSGADLRGADLTGAKLVGTKLSGTNLADANLTNADLTRAFMFSTNLTGANLDGATTTGAQRCQMTQPDGSFVIGSVEDAQGREVPCIGGPAETPTTTAAGASGPPRVEFFRQANPKRCITDVAGEGIDIEWSTPNATSLTFYVDGIRIESATKTHGVKRVPFRCDGRVHIVSVQAFGPTPPSASALFTATLDATAPLTSDD